MMTKADVFMNGFMKKLENNDYKKETQPNNGPLVDEAFVEEQLASYVKVLSSGILDVVDKK